DLKALGLPGLAVGRMAGLMMYLSPNLFKNKFGRDYVTTDGLYELFGRFEVEKYLEYNSYSFPKFFDPLSYLYICKTINIFDAGRNKDKLEDSFDKIQAKLHLIAFSDDMLFFPEEMEEIRDIMIKLGRKDQVTYKLINSNSGHDSFLVEVEKFQDYVKDILKDNE
ncbi:homoserine O-acetyltransferase, partial [Aliarcobacter butzleri]|nr:homoserine O-acetyltransferase [Aliarcobacter butzleri]